MKKITFLVFFIIHISPKLYTQEFGINDFQISDRATSNDKFDFKLNLEDGLYMIIAKNSETLIKRKILIKN